MSSTAATHHRTVRRLPLPDCQPPYDDELPQRPRGVDRAAADQRAPGGEYGHGVVQGTLALAFVLPNGLPAAPVAPPELRLVPPPGPARGERPADEVDFGPQPTATAALPDARHWAGRFVQAVVEVLAGDRPHGQLVRWTSAEVYDEIGARVAPPDPRSALITRRAVVRSVHISEPADGVAEIAALVRGDRRTTAVALRLEGLDGRWQCTALELG